MNILKIDSSAKKLLELKQSRLKEYLELVKLTFLPRDSNKLFFSLKAIALYLTEKTQTSFTSFKTTYHKTPISYWRLKIYEEREVLRGLQHILKKSKIIEKNTIKKEQLSKKILKTKGRTKIPNHDLPSLLLDLHNLKEKIISLSLQLAKKSEKKTRDHVQNSIIFDLAVAPDSTEQQNPNRMISEKQLELLKRLMT